MISIPPDWTIERYKAHNDSLARKYGEPTNLRARALERARHHLRTAEQLCDPRARVLELHAAVCELIRVVDGEETAS